MLTVISLWLYMAICLPLHYDIIMISEPVPIQQSDLESVGAISGSHVHSNYFLHHFLWHPLQSRNSPALMTVWMRLLLLPSWPCCNFFVSSLIDSPTCTYYLFTESAICWRQSQGLFHFLHHLWVSEYLRPHSESPNSLDMFFTIMYTIVPPTLNSIIYSLINHAIGSSLRKFFTE